MLWKGCDIAPPAPVCYSDCFEPISSIIIEDAKGTDPIGQGPDNSNGYMRSRDPNLAFAATSCGRGIREAPSEALKNLVAINSVDAVWRLVGPVDPDPANKVRSAAKPHLGSFEEVN